MLSHIVTLVLLASSALAQNGTTTPLVERCGPANVACVNRYASVLPLPFFRNRSVTGTIVGFSQTSVIGPSFDLISESPFVIFDRERGLELVGSNPQYDFVFSLPPETHEAPVYVPAQNKFYFSRLTRTFLPQLIIDLNNDPPTLSEFLSDPPVFRPNGGTFFNGSIYWGASGGSTTLPGGEQRSGIRVLDPNTNKTTTLLNNYYGYYWNNVNDLVVDGNGIIWFTDAQYPWFSRGTDTPPFLATAVYRFDPSTGEARAVDTGLVQPNGIALSPDGANIYVADSGANTGIVDPAVNASGTFFNQTGPRFVYKYDVVNQGRGLANRQLIFYAPEGQPDGVKVAANGIVGTAAGRGVDFFDEFGSYIARVQTNFTVQNFAWAGPELDEIWLVGTGGVARARFNLTGLDLADPPCRRY